MQKLLNKVKPKLTEPPPSRVVPTYLTSANVLEVIPSDHFTLTPPDHQLPIHPQPLQATPLLNTQSQVPTREERLLDTLFEANPLAGRPDQVSLMTSTSSLVKMTRLYLTHLQKPSPDPKTEAISRSVVEYGTEHVVSHGGTSQYNRDGTGASACGLAALNFARIVFSMEQSGLKDTALLQAVLARECVEVRRLYSNPPI